MQRPHEAPQQPAGTADSPEAETEGPTGLQDHINTGLLLDSLPLGASEAQRLLILCHLLLQVRAACDGLRLLWLFRELWLV